MKRVFSLLLGACLILSLGACSNAEQAPVEEEVIPVVQPEPVPETPAEEKGSSETMDDLFRGMPLLVLDRDEDIPEEEVEEDIPVLYPIVASLSKGQRAGLEFLSLLDLFNVPDISFLVQSTSFLKCS